MRNVVFSLKLSKLAEMGNESTRLHVETWDQTHGKLVNKNTCFHMVNMSYWLIYNNLTMWGPPSYLGWFRFAPVTSSLFAYHKP